jgi:hypothetical protein
MGVIMEIIHLGESSTESEKIGLTMVCSDIIVLIFNKAMTDTCLTAVKIGAKYG